MEQVTIEKARAVKKAAHDMFSKLGPVVGVGIMKCESGFGIKVNLSKPLESGHAVPTHVDGVKVEVAYVQVKIHYNAVRYGCMHNSAVQCYATMHNTMQ